MRIAWRSVGRVVTRVVADAQRERDRFANLTRIGIDEISYKRRQNYLTVVVDHDTGRLIWAAPGRSEATLRKFFDELGEERSHRITVVTADAADWIHKVVKERCPAAFLIVDALMLKVRKNGHIRSQSALLAMGVNEDGYREILGLRLGDSESRDSWGEFFTWLKGRGLRGVDLVTSDDHAGLVQAIRQHFQNATWQRCQTHATRNVLDACPNSLQTELRSQLRLLFTAPDEATARQVLDHIVTTYETRAPQAIRRLEAAFDDAIAILSYPEPYRKRMRTTNIVERLNEEIRRRERVIRIFPNGDSVTRLLGALLMEQDETWSTGRKYFDMTAYWEWRHPHVTAAD